ncbi:hypothetical protein P5V15_011921 [Pogonomyrmex californicus]
MPGYNFTRKTEQPHIVYKRNSDEYQTATTRDFCNVIGKTSKIITKRALNQQKGVPARSIGNRSYTLELLVVLDKSLLDYYKEFDIENYILTLFNMAS